MIEDLGTICPGEIERLTQRFGHPRVYHSAVEIEAMTHEDAMNVLRHVRRVLLVQLMHQERHEHMLDDCGDYLTAATDGWGYLHKLYFENDGDPLLLTEGVKRYLTAPMDDREFPWGGCDGEARYDLLSEELADKAQPSE